jgi:hypothetical protein
VDLFVRMDCNHYELDENKKELMAFWYRVIRDYPSNVELITSNRKLIQRLLDFFVSLRSNERWIQYNSVALPNFYKVLYLCCAESRSFLDELMFHGNWSWAVKVST